MYLHVKKVGELDVPEQADPFALVAAGRVELIHSECLGGAMNVEDKGATVTLVCGKCQTRQDLEREEAADALLRVLVHEEYAWAGDAGLLPD